jgi:hypothetical protein
VAGSVFSGTWQMVAVCKVCGIDENNPVTKGKEMKVKIGRIKYADPKFKLTTIGKVRVGSYFYLPIFQIG